MKSKNQTSKTSTHKSAPTSAKEEPTQPSKAQLIDPVAECFITPDENAQHAVILRPVRLFFEDDMPKDREAYGGKTGTGSGSTANKVSEQHRACPQVFRREAYGALAFDGTTRTYIYPMFLERKWQGRTLEFLCEVSLRSSCAKRFCWAASTSET